MHRSEVAFLVQQSSVHGRRRSVGKALAIERGQQFLTLLRIQSQGWIAAGSAAFHRPHESHAVYQRSLPRGRAAPQTQGLASRAFSKRRGKLLYARHQVLPGLLFCSSRASSAPRTNFFLDVDDEVGLVQLDLELVVLARELRNLQRVGAARISLGAALLRCQGCQIARLALAPPCAQGGRVHPLAAHQRTDLAGACAVICLLQNAAFVGLSEDAATRPRHDLGVGVGRLGRPRRCGRICGRPTGFLRCDHIGQTLHCFHRDL